MTFLPWASQTGSSRYLNPIMITSNYVIIVLLFRFWLLDKVMHCFVLPMITPPPAAGSFILRRRSHLFNVRNTDDWFQAGHRLRTSPAEGWGRTLTHADTHLDVCVHGARGEEVSERMKAQTGDAGFVSHQSPQNWTRQGVTLSDMKQDHSKFTRDSLAWKKLF